MPLMPRNYVKSGFAEYLYMHVIHVIHVSLYYIIIMNASFFCYSVVCCNCLMGICIVFLFVVVCSFAVFALALCCVCVCDWHAVTDSQRANAWAYRGSSGKARDYSSNQLGFFVDEMETNKQKQFHIAYG